MPIDTSTLTRRRRPSSAKLLLPSAGSKTPHKAGKRKANNIMTEQHPSMLWVLINAVFYVLSGVTQPIIMAYASHAGLANPKCQLYMLFYYIGPALAAFTLRCSPRKKRKSVEEPSHKQTSDSLMQQLLSNDDRKKRYNAQDDASFDVSSNKQNDMDEEEEHWPSRTLLLKASGIGIFDIFAQSTVYTGNNLAGPTVFAIIYSSVTIWAALFSRMLLSRSLVKLQWFGVCLVVLGLALAAMDSKTVGKNVFAGACLILVGSSFHGLTYVMSEKIMTPSPITTNSSGANHAAKEPEHLSIRANCAVQGIVATLAVLLWQIFYTLPRLEPLVLAPMRESGTTALHALFILVTITMANLVHSLTFYVTLRHFPGGATSAGVLKGLQAVLVFAASAYLLCEKWGGRETCWSNSKFVSLVIVVSGIMMYGAFTEKKGKIRQSSFCDEDVDIL
jgi:drug/metabolite transporter (DMT)-like permease